MMINFDAITAHKTPPQMRGRLWLAKIGDVDSLSLHAAAPFLG